MRMPNLTEALASALTAMIEQGMQLPIYCVSVSANGSVLACHYVEDGDGLDCRMVAEHIEEAGFAVPINVIFSDSSGKAEKIVIARLLQ